MYDTEYFGKTVIFYTVIHGFVLNPYREMPHLLLVYS